MDPDIFPSTPLVPPRPLLPAPAREHLRPDYSAEFRCIGSACEDTCCRGWSVPIDQATYEKYRSHRALQPFVGSFIILNTTSPSTADYARMPLTMTGTCGFLDEAHLCGIQKHLGPEMLSVTCATYPRAVQSQTGELETALNLSCPEAARLVLLHQAPLGVTPWPLQLPSAYGSIWQDDGTHLRPGEVYLTIRDFVITLLRDRRYPVWQRLYLLGPMIRRLKALAGGQHVSAFCDANPTVVAHILADSARTAASLRLQPTMDSLVAHPADQLQLVAEILRMRLAEPPNPPRFLECVQEFELGLCTQTARTEQEILDAFAPGRRTLDTLLEQHPQLIENYLINHVFKNSFPFGRRSLRVSPGSVPDPETEHTLICVLATLAQTLLTGMAAHHGERFGLAHVVKLIQSLAKAIEHGTTFPAHLAEYVQQRGPDAILIRSVIVPHSAANQPPANHLPSNQPNPSPTPAHPRPSARYPRQKIPTPSIPAHSAP